MLIFTKIFEMSFENTREFARELDLDDPLKKYRQDFVFPKINQKEVIYFTGNSLGLQPKIAKDYVNEIMQDWASLAVEGHFHGDKPWWDYHERFQEKLAKVVGAKPAEITVMNTLTVNLNLLMVSFYRPNATRFKIICEEKAFPSDQYMLASQVRFHGLDPEDCIIEVKKRPGEHHFRTQDILRVIKDVGSQCALVLFGGVNYYNGQVLDMQAITKAGKAVGAMVGWDLAHAAGNVELDLHNWDVDFAAWCSYKYMNAGPGSASGCYINQRYHGRKDIPRFEGWWGHNKEKRFLMEPEFEPESDANAWQISNAPVLSMAPYLASLELFDEVGMPALIAKRKQLVAFLDFIIKEIEREVNADFEIITPTEPEYRASQLSILLHGEGRGLFEYLMKNGVVTDWREPNVIRLAPVPLYTSYVDLFDFGQILKKGIS